MGGFFVFGELEEEFVESVFRVDRGGEILRAPFGFGELDVADLVKGVGGEAAVRVAVEDDLVGVDGFLVLFLILVGLAEFELHGRRELRVGGGGEDRCIHFGGAFVAAVVHERVGDGDLGFDGAIEFAGLRIALEEFLVGIECAFGVAEGFVKFTEAELCGGGGGRQRIIADQCAVGGDGALGVA